MTVLMERTDTAEFNAAVITEFRARNGTVGGSLADTPLVLVHHVGARSGVVRVVPLAYLALGDGRYVIIASDGGSAHNPAWYHNLKATPNTMIEIGDETFPVMAEELDPEARSTLWPTIVAWAPTVDEFQNMTTRTIPVFILTRTS